MRIGFTSIYSWRPHVEHLYFLAGLARQDGHETRFLTCDADLPSCYTRELRPQRADWVHCARCRVGGIRSFAGRDVTSIGALHADPAATGDQGAAWARSSASTLGRFESDADFDSAEFRELAARLAPAAALAYAAARRWIEVERLDAIVLFNGRMDATRGILEAARDAGIRALSVERTWFGDGLQLLPDEDCLGLRSVHRLMTQWRERPLAREQALRAASHVASRFLRRNVNEWRAYNTGAHVAPWPVVGGRRRVLLVPGSRNEVWGHPDWDCGWSERTAAFDALIDHLGLRPADLLLRCHPNWGENIGSRSGELSERYYSEWARSRGVRTIASTDPTSTLGLIEQSDAVVVCGGSAALEAGILGKQVIAVTPSVYARAGFETTVCAPAQLASLRLDADLDAAARAAAAARVARRTLRFAYTMVYRVPQFVRHVRCLTTTRYEYPAGADPRRLSALLVSGELAADDERFAANEEDEDVVLAAIGERAWQALQPPSAPAAVADRIRRRWMFRPIDRIREAMPRGDL